MVHVSLALLNRGLNADYQCLDFAYLVLVFVAALLEALGLVLDFDDGEAEVVDFLGEAED